MNPSRHKSLARVLIRLREDQLSAINRIALEKRQNFSRVVRDLIDKALRTDRAGCTQH